MAVKLNYLIVFGLFALCASFSSADYQRRNFRGNSADYERRNLRAKLADYMRRNFREDSADSGSDEMVDSARDNKYIGLTTHKRAALPTCSDGFCCNGAHRCLPCTYNGKTHYCGDGRGNGYYKNFDHCNADAGPGGPNVGADYDCADPHGCRACSPAPALPPTCSNDFCCNHANLCTSCTHNGVTYYCGDGRGNGYYKNPDHCNADSGPNGPNVGADYFCAAGYCSSCANLGLGG